MADIRSPLLRYHGGKWRIAPWVISHFPPHRVYVESFGGAAGVLLRKPRTDAEVYNDMDDDIVNLFRVVRDAEAAQTLAAACEATPYARAELDLANEETSDPVERARRTLFRAWASFGSAGATRGRTGFRTYTKPDARYSGVAHCWSRVPDVIALVCQRFKNVVIENRPAIDVMQQHDSTETLHYVDPPYLPETRSFDGGRYYRHEMMPEDHELLIQRVHSLSGMVVLSGYESELYNDTLTGWSRERLNTSGSSRYGSNQRTECLWLSPNCDHRGGGYFHERLHHYFLYLIAPARALGDSMSLPILCIYHANCADGFGAAWAVRHALGNTVEFHPGKYGETPPDATDRHVVIVDFSYPRDVIHQMACAAKSVLILDHHKTAAHELEGFSAPAETWYDHIQEAEAGSRPHIRAIFDMQRSGAGLTWDYFHDEPRPALINHIEDRDLWRFNLAGTKEIQAALFSYPYDFKVWDELMCLAGADLQGDGEAITRKHMKDIHELIRTASATMAIAGYQVPTLNAPYFYSSEAGHIMAKGHPFAACYWDTPKGRTFSLRSTDGGIDVSEIAKLFGGGGHRNAAGFQIGLDAVAAAPHGPVIPSHTCATDPVVYIEPSALRAARMIAQPGERAQVAAFPEDGFTVPLYANPVPAAARMRDLEQALSLAIHAERHTPEGYNTLAHCEQILGRGAGEGSEYSRGWNDRATLAQQPTVPKALDPWTNNGDQRPDFDYRRGWNACREAMLAAKDTQSDQPPT